ncbi:MAG: TlpA family protein disulfide reductase [Gemmataceae bacterium]|nr:TlpA family protein disulfide reductase [Gemmataceae bacterium]
MKTTLHLFVCAGLLGQPTSRSEWQLAPQLAPGLELVYSGTFQEESLVPHVQFQRTFHLDTRLLVLDGSSRAWHLAVLTTISPGDGNSEPARKKSHLSSVRLEVGWLDAQGRFRDSVGVVPPLPLTGPPTIETGCFLEGAPERLTKTSQWEVNDEPRPPRSWQVLGVEVVGAVSCIKVLGQQSSPDWDRPRADQTAWRRRDTLWLHPQLGVAEKVERIIERRDPARRDPTQRFTIIYQLKDRFRYPGQLFEDRKREIAQAKRLQDDAAALLRQSALPVPQLDALLTRASHYLDHPSTTPYRLAVYHVKSRLEAAKAGKLPVEPASQETTTSAPAVPGRRISDFVVNDLTSGKSARLSRYLGRPVLVCFYLPTEKTGLDVLRFAKHLVQLHGDKVAILAMAVTQDTALVRQQHADLQLPFAICDGRGMHRTFGVDATPRLVLLDGDGVVRAAHTGWGYHVPLEIEDELERLLSK